MGVSEVVGHVVLDAKLVPTTASRNAGSTFSLEAASSASSSTKP